jgi:hypothetical protein
MIQLMKNTIEQQAEILASAPVRLTQEEVWVRMWTSVAASSNCCDKNAAIAWADHGLTAFNGRFRNQ